MSRAARHVEARSPAEFVAPMKALASTVIPTGTWHCEIKFDGYRAVAVIDKGNVQLWSRNRKELSADFPEVVAELKKLHCTSAVIDGEIVALDTQGRSRFQLLQNRGAADPDSRIVYYAFDLMQLDGVSRMADSLEQRTGFLKHLVKGGGRHVQLSREFLTEPVMLFAEAAKNGLEGIIAKRPDSIYEPDRRSGAWLKCKVVAEQEFVVGGFTEPRNSRQYFGALLVGYFEGGKLRYAGKVGTGFDGAMLGDLHAQFLKKKVEKCPFSDLPSNRKSRFGAGMGPTEMRRVTWIRPAFVAQVKFAEWTGDGLLRQPVFLGLRRDKAAKDVGREPGPIQKRGKAASMR
ncbi:MAG TPA: non-homologous end-joining DNA ligase [Opitutaceae bacterium]|nr:non-homologous end-joining DNA ligase [Opitutaceae bacterium]